MPDGRTLQGEFNGYWDMRSFGGGLRPAISYPQDSGLLTTGILPSGATLLTPIPSFEEWQLAQPQQPTNAA